jgi:hypothetical protein
VFYYHFFIEKDKRGGAEKPFELEELDFYSYEKFALLRMKSR